jgi:orotate phosphoribosyltransferase
MADDRRERLLATIREHGYLQLADPIQLSSGEWSRHFVDGKRGLAEGADLALCCRLIAESVAGAGIDYDAVGGLTLGADQFAHGVAIVAGKRWFVVRKEPKGRGTNKLVEGAELGPGVRVLLVDDAITTGGSIQKAHVAVSETGAEVVAAATLLDRGNTARAYFEERGVTYLPLFTGEDFGIPPLGSEAASPTG